MFVNTTATANGVVVARGKLEIALKHAFAASAYEDQYLSMFWDIYLPCGRPYGTRLAGQYPTGSWIAVAKELSSQESAVRKSLLAVCMILIGQRDKQPWMIHESLQLYTSALDEVRTALCKSSNWSCDAMLVASRALAAYEVSADFFRQYVADELVVVGKSRSNFIVRVFPTEKLAQSQSRTECNYITQKARRLHGGSITSSLRGWTNTTGEHLLQTVNSTDEQIIASFLNNKQCFLADPAWRTIPWTNIPKSPKDHLLDVAAQVPGLLEDLDFMTKHSDLEDHSIAHRLRRNYADIHVAFDAWEETYWPIEELEELSNRGEDEPTATDMLAAHLATCFWTGKLIAHNTMRIAYAISPTIDPEPAWLESWAKEAQDELCANIANLIWVLLHPAAGVFWSQYSMFPVAISLLHLTTTQQLESDLANKLLDSYSGQVHREALVKFVLGVLKEWPGFRAASSPSAKNKYLNLSKQDAWIQPDIEVCMRALKAS